MTQSLQISPDSSSGPTEDTVLGIAPDEAVRPVFGAPGLEGLGVARRSGHGSASSSSGVGSGR
jgi:hypothetical protein